MKTKKLMLLAAVACLLMIFNSGYAKVYTLNNGMRSVDFLSLAGLRTAATKHVHNPNYRGMKSVDFLSLAGLRKTVVTKKIHFTNPVTLDVEFDDGAPLDWTITLSSPFNYYQFTTTGPYNYF